MKTPVLCEDADAVECANCDWRGTGAECNEISDFGSRVSAGEVCPAGECPKCGSLASVVQRA